ncbi:MAG: choice-of-anchor V domain-containing protein [Candidatus Poseidoniaceae archaeon]|nr:hypothetical protein [Euryarchaeota archaeon]OUX48482.1 MAG: hypothetical protein CBE39_01915 [Euryarchaeota archaeon TMED279]|tara:strand:- start:207 stop:1154 length:948 start_codon:yes stop_codon:yes gene_type:complete
MSRKYTLLLVATLALMMAAPVYGNSQGPPWMHNDRIIPEEGCSCHGAGGSPSSEIILSVSGVPRTYETGETYNLTISLTHVSYNTGGFMIWDYEAGTFAVSDGTKVVPDSGGAISHDAPGNDWIVPWTAPSEDMGDIHFSLAGNVVDGSGAPDAGDHWTTLSFTVSAPGTATADEDVSLRTISVGDYDSLFGQKSDAQIEAERQAEMANNYFEQGNLYFWTTLSILIIAAVIQGEFYERRFGGGPTNLDMSLAVPQGIRRGIVTLGLAIGFGWAVDTELPWGYTLVIAMCMLWGIFGVYRTVVQARAEKEAMDLI